MTREFFLDEVTCWDELLSEANEQGYDLDVMDADTFDDCVEEDVTERECNWRELYDYLDSVPEYDRWSYYRRDGWLDYRMMDDGDDFIYAKDDFLEWMDSEGLWDEPEIDEEEEFEPGQEEEPVDDGFSMDIFNECKDTCVEIVSAEKESNAETIEGGPYDVIHTIIDEFNPAEFDFVF